MNTGEIKEMFEHCDPARWISFYQAVTAMLLDADMTDAEFRSSCAAFQDACNEGARLYMARMRGGFVDDE